MRGILLAACLAMRLAAVEIDWQAVENPEAIRLGDRAAEARWRALFAREPAWISRQITYLAERVKAQAPTLLAARLLWRGEPWGGSGDQGNPRRWRLADVEVRSALLREMRWMKEPAFSDVYKHLLAVEEDPGLVVSALVNLWQLDRTVAVAYAAYLGDPRRIPPGRRGRLPGAAVSAVRQDCLALLMGILGPGAPETRGALEWALLQATGGERVHALDLLERGQSGDLVQAALINLARERREGVLDDDGVVSVALGCARLGGVLDSALAANLVEIAVKGGREIAAPAAAALAANVAWTATVPVGEVAARAATDPDPVMRHVLRGLLLRINAAAMAKGDPDDPWTQLGAHRTRLSGWEWEQYVR